MPEPGRGSRRRSGAKAAAAGPNPDAAGRPGAGAVPGAVPGAGAGAMEGDLTRDERARVVDALARYRQGWFPMFMPEDEGGEPKLQWVQPMRRGVIPLEAPGFRVSRSLRQRVRSRRFTITTDRAFGRVIRECGAGAPGREETWINEEIIATFELLHRAGHAHSVEAWLEGEAGPVLVGGLYGLAIGRVFCGESMFSRPGLGGTDASKVCLVHLVHHLRRRGYEVLDAQMTNPHLARLGCRTMANHKYVAMLAGLVGERVAWEPFEAERTVEEIGRGEGVGAG